MVTKHFGNFESDQLQTSRSQTTFCQRHKPASRRRPRTYYYYWELTECVTTDVCLLSVLWLITQFLIASHLQASVCVRATWVAEADGSSALSLVPLWELLKMSTSKWMALDLTWNLNKDDYSLHRVLCHLVSDYSVNGYTTVCHCDSRQDGNDVVVSMLEMLCC